MPRVASVRSQNALSNARIRSGLCTCEKSGGTAKGTHDLLPSRSTVSMCPWNGRGHDPDLGVGHCRASTCKTKPLLQGHFWMTSLSLHIQTSWIGPSNCGGTFDGPNGVGFRLFIWTIWRCSSSDSMLWIKTMAATRSWPTSCPCKSGYRCRCRKQLLSEYRTLAGHKAPLPLWGSNPPVFRGP